MKFSLRSLALAGVLFCGMVSVAQAGLQIYYIRHAESGHNALKFWKDLPKEEWPAYVGNEDAFSDKGQQQRQRVPAKLEKYQFDFIAVSPLWRTRNTIRPYLEKVNRQAEIWPELAETVKCANNEGLPAPSAGLFFTGPALALPQEDKALFFLRAGTDHQCRAARDGLQAQADANAMARAAMALIQQRFGGTSKSILLVGHGNAGANFLHALTGDYSTTIGIANTGLWMAEEQADGSFKIKIANDVPVKELEAASAPR